LIAETQVLVKTCPHATFFNRYVILIGGIKPRPLAVRAKLT